MSGSSDRRPSLALRRVVVAALLIALAFVGFAPASADAAPRVTPTPTISGTARVGKTLRVKVGTWRPSVSAHPQWLRDGKKIKGAKGFSYTLTGADAGARISVQITGTQWKLRPVTRTSKKTKKVALGGITSKKVTLSNDPQVDGTITAKTGYWKPAESVRLSYQWLRDGKKIAGATKQVYAPVVADAGKRLSVTVTGKAKGYTSVAVTSKRSAAVARGTFWVNVGGIYILSQNQPRAGSTLSVATGLWRPKATLAYQWLRNGDPITGATDNTYTVRPADGGTEVMVRVTGSRPGYISRTFVSESVYVLGPDDYDLEKIKSRALRECIDRATPNTVTGWLMRAEAERITSLECPYGGVETLEGFPALPNLTKLDLVNSLIPGLAGLPAKTPSLEWLRFGTADGVTDFTALRDVAEWSDLSYLGIVKGDLETLHGMPPMPSLEMFVVGRTKLRDVKGLPDLPNLRLLSVVYNEVTSLDDLPDLPALRTLYVHANKLTSVGGLADRVGLKELWVYDNPLAAPAADKEALQPLVDAGCLILWEPRA